MNSGECKVNTTCTHTPVACVRYRLIIMICVVGTISPWVGSSKRGPVDIPLWNLLKLKADEVLLCRNESFLPLHSKGGQAPLLQKLGTPPQTLGTIHLHRMMIHKPQSE